VNLDHADWASIVIAILHLKSPQFVFILVVFVFRGKKIAEEVLGGTLLQIRRDRDVQGFVLDAAALHIRRRVNKVGKNGFFLLAGRTSRNKVFDCTPVLKEVMSLDEIRNPRGQNGPIPHSLPVAANKISK